MSDRSVTLLILMVVAFGLLWALFQKREAEPRKTLLAALTPEMVPLVTGDEPINAIFTKAGCPVCHRIPGIAGAEGRVGPPLVLGSTGAERLRDPSYRGRAKTVHEYVVESVVEPDVFVVAGYPPSTMPTWYGTRLSALALEKIAAYLERQTWQVAEPIK
ncbi:MAG TPA: hypothetical protein VIU63_10435 [Nitrospira sp.]